MAKLTEPQKLFIIKALACFDTPSHVARAVRDEFGLEVTRQQVAEYDPSKASGRDVSVKLRAIFAETRKAFLAEVTAIPFANLSTRIRALSRMVHKTEEQGNVVVAAQLLEQISKDIGGMFTNRREVTGADGGPLHSVSAVAPMTLADFYANQASLSAPQPASGTSSPASDAA